MIQEADSALTDMAMSGGRYAADQVLRVTFSSRPFMNEKRSKEEGRPIYEDTDYITIMQPGNKDSIVTRPITELDKSRFAERYKAYQARQDEEQVEGTMLEHAPWITRAQVEELKYLNIRTVEQLAGLSDSNAQGIMGIQMLKQRAANYLESAKEGAAAEALKEQRELNAQLTARLEALESEAPKKRGRPKKAPTQE